MYTNFAFLLNHNLVQLTHNFNPQYLHQSHVTSTVLRPVIFFHIKASAQKP